MNYSDNPFVLIVDDNPFNRQILKELLKTEGFSIVEARNGKEAIEHIKTSEFRLIFMDLLMPGMDGFETIQRIRGMGIATPIIIVSSMSAKQDRQRCIEAGGNDFLPKPIEIGTVKELVRKYGADRPRGPEISDISRKEERHPFPLNFSDYHLMLVEENEVLADRYRQFLTGMGFNVTRVPDGMKALALFEENRHRFNMILSNVFTPEIDGIGLLARVRREYAGVPVFIYSAEHDTDTFQLAIQLGADGVFSAAEIETSFAEIFESAIWQAAQKGSRTQAASTVRQVRKAQEQLIRYGCPEPCDSIAIAYSPLTDAGGDLACCRRFNLAGRCGIMLGDVSGHNVISSYISAISLGILTSTWNRNQEPLGLLKNINAELNKADYEKYHLCAGILLWDRRRRKIEIASAGIPGGIIAKKDADGSYRFHELEGGGLCLGLVKEDHLFLTAETELDQGDYFFLFSDGIRKEQITEALSSGTVCLDRENIRGISQDILDRILEKDGQDDDMILIAVRQSETFRNCGYHYEFRSDYTEAEQACRWAAGHCTPDRIPRGHDLCLIMVALREALINAVRHGNKFNHKGYVDLSLYFEPDMLRIEISDTGPGFQLPETIQKIEAIDVFQSGGRGLSAMYSIADRMTVAGGTVSLIFQKKTGCRLQVAGYRLQVAGCR